MVYMYELLLMVQVNFIIGKSLGQNKVVETVLIKGLIQKDDKLASMAKKSRLMVYKPYFEANTEDVSASALENLFCRNYNTIILIKF